MRCVALCLAAAGHAPLLFLSVLLTCCAISTGYASYLHVRTEHLAGLSDLPRRLAAALGFTSPRDATVKEHFNMDTMISLFR